MARSRAQTPASEAVPVVVDETPADEAPEIPEGFVPVEYVGPHDGVDGLGAVWVGRVAHVPAGVAGSPPVEATEDEEGSPGSGLLAQADNWRVKE